MDELLSDVIRHAATAARVVANVDNGRLRQEVHDGSSPPLCIELGRRFHRSRLHLVAMVVDDWGWARVGLGKCV
jgi:hypothetical protein